MINVKSKNKIVQKKHSKKTNTMKKKGKKGGDVTDLASITPTTSLNKRPSVKSNSGQASQSANSLKSQYVTAPTSLKPQTMSNTNRKKFSSLQPQKNSPTFPNNFQSVQPSKQQSNSNLSLGLLGPENTTGLSSYTGKMTNTPSLLGSYTGSNINSMTGIPMSQTNTGPCYCRQIQNGGASKTRKSKLQSMKMSKLQKMAVSNGIKITKKNYGRSFNIKKTSLIIKLLSK